MKRVVVLGGTGFIGQSLCEQLARAGIKATVPTRSPQAGKRLAHLPTVTVVQTDVHQPDALTQLLAGHDAVVNLVAILHGSPAQFERTHVQLADTLAKACLAANVLRVVHVSALGASADAPSEYQRSKAAGEATLLQHPQLHTTVLRPSVVFGAQDAFLNLFAALVRLTPVLPLAGADTRFAPVWVADVASAIVQSLRTPQSVGQVVDCVGPDVFKLRELVKLCARWQNRWVGVLGLPQALGMVQATMLEFAPGPTLMSRDNVRSMQVDNIANANAHTWRLERLGIQPASLLAIGPTYIRPSRQTPQTQKKPR
ncbi:complex I NDUFA9 subunit family protein [Comamonadaceae bacterium M7527]|nr:complex I NDUFA9 subunit family protein [Comamonadaceae bacterium M7527]